MLTDLVRGDNSKSNMSRRVSENQPITEKLLDEIEECAEHHCEVNDVLEHLSDG